MTIRHVCGDAPDLCMCVYDPACNPDAKRMILLPESTVEEIIDLIQENRVEDALQMLINSLPPELPT